MLLVLLRRVIVLVILLAVLGGIAIAVGVTVGRPIVEDRVASALGDELGTSVEVSTSGSAGDLARGDLGDVEATAARVERGGIEIEDVRVVARDASVDVGALRDREVRVTTKGIGAEGRISEEALDLYVRPQLAKSPLRQVRAARVVIEDGAIVLRSGRTSVGLAPSVLPNGDLAFAAVPRGTGAPARAAAAAVDDALGDPIAIGELPFDVRLTEVAVDGDRLLVRGSAPPGEPRPHLRLSGGRRSGAGDAAARGEPEDHVRGRPLRRLRDGAGGEPRPRALLDRERGRERADEVRRCRDDAVVADRDRAHAAGSQRRRDGFAQRSGAGVDVGDDGRGAADADRLLGEHARDRVADERERRRLRGVRVHDGAVPGARQREVERELARGLRAGAPRAGREVDLAHALGRRLAGGEARARHEQRARAVLRERDVARAAGGEALVGEGAVGGGDDLAHDLEHGAESTDAERAPGAPPRPREPAAVRVPTPWRYAPEGARIRAGTPTERGVRCRSRSTAVSSR